MAEVHIDLHLEFKVIAFSVNGSFEIIEHFANDESLKPAVACLLALRI